MSLAVVLSAVGIWLGFPIADPIIGLLITVAILFVLRDAAKEVYRRLMDTVDPHLVDQAEEVIRATPGVVEVTDVRLRWHGHKLLAEARITVDSTMSLVDAHLVSHQVEHELVHGVRRLAAATTHRDGDGQAIYDSVPSWGPHPDVPEPLAAVVLIMEFESTYAARAFWPTIADTVNPLDPDDKTQGSCPIRAPRSSTAPRTPSPLAASCR